MAEAALGHDDEEGPALGVVAELLRKADLGLPEAFCAALASAVEEEEDGGLLGLFAGKFGVAGVGLVGEGIGEVDLEFIAGAAKGERAVEKAGFLMVRGVGEGSAYREQ
jgi:hypothetical protein